MKRRRKRREERKIGQRERTTYVVRFRNKREDALEYPPLRLPHEPTPIAFILRNSIQLLLLSRSPLLVNSLPLPLIFSNPNSISFHSLPITLHKPKNKNKNGRKINKKQRDTYIDLFLCKHQRSYHRNMCSKSISESEQEQLIEKLELFKIHGRDKQGRKILRIIGKFLPARLVSVEVVKKYLTERVYPRLAKKPFSVLYVHTGVQRTENFAGISALRSIYDAIPVNVKENLQAVYFVHPGLQARLFLATFGRLFFNGGFYGKLRYVSRVDYLWEHIRRNEIEIPEFVIDHDEDLEYRPMMDHGLESECDHPRVYGAPAVDSPTLSIYSMRCIS